MQVSKFILKVGKFIPMRDKIQRAQLKYNLATP